MGWPSNPPQDPSKEAREGRARLLTVSRASRSNPQAWPHPSAQLSSACPRLLLPLSSWPWTSLHSQHSESCFRPQLPPYLRALTTQTRTFTQGSARLAPSTGPRRSSLCAVQNKTQQQFRPNPDHKALPSSFWDRAGREGWPHQRKQFWFWAQKNQTHHSRGSSSKAGV